MGFLDVTVIACCSCQISLGSFIYLIFCFLLVFSLPSLSLPPPPSPRAPLLIGKMVQTKAPFYWSLQNWVFYLIIRGGEENLNKDVAITEYMYCLNDAKQWCSWLVSYYLSSFALSVNNIFDILYAVYINRSIYLNRSRRETISVLKILKGLWLI